MPDAATGDKILANAKYFVFGSTDEFRHGLRGRLRRSMRQEFEENEGGKWLVEYIYVVCCAAIAVPDVPKERPNRLAAIAKYEAIGLKAIGKRDLVNDGKTFEDFCRHAEAVAAGLSAAEVAALRLYTGPAFQSMNAKLRLKDYEPWATTTGCCSSAILKLSYLSKQMRVYRGVKENEVQLPDAFLNAPDGEFAGGVELGFMSTTPLADVALFHSGTGRATPPAAASAAATRAAAMCPAARAAKLVARTSQSITTMRQVVQRQPGLKLHRARAAPGSGVGSGSSSSDAHVARAGRPAGGSLTFGDVVCAFVCVVSDAAVVASLCGSERPRG
jgi:hypothetical protein